MDGLFGLLPIGSIRLHNYEFCLDLLSFEESPVQLIVRDQNGEFILNEVLEEPGMQYCFPFPELEDVEDFLFEVVSLEGGSFLIDNLQLQATCTEGVQIANVWNTQDYYPFGMVMPGRSYQGSEGYRYGFQRQEVDPEIKGEGNSVNFKYRMYDPRLGRFFAIDPLAAKYAYNSPYAFSENRVLDAIELEGLEKILLKNSQIMGRRATRIELADDWHVYKLIVVDMRDPNNIVISASFPEELMEQALGETELLDYGVRFPNWKGGVIVKGHEEKRTGNTQDNSGLVTDIFPKSAEIPLHFRIGGFSSIEARARTFSNRGSTTIFNTVVVSSEDMPNDPDIDYVRVNINVHDEDGNTPNNFKVFVDGVETDFTDNEGVKLQPGQKISIEIEGEGGNADDQFSVGVNQEAFNIQPVDD